MNAPEAQELMPSSVGAIAGIDARMPSAGDRLDSWKEIAAYLRRSVRCAQRWEKNERLPILRHRHSHGATVFAYRWELDEWWHGQWESSGDSEARLMEIRRTGRTTSKKAAQVAVGATQDSEAWQGKEPRSR
jgi:aromatic ring hydroxylase